MPSRPPLPEMYLKSGFNYVNIEKVSRSLLCAICSRPMVTPVKGDNCKHQFCEECIQNAFHGDVGQCPAGKETIDKQNLQPVDPSIVEKLDQLQAYCWNRPYSCPYVGTRESLPEHFFKCKFMPCPERINGCQTMGDPRFVDQHARTCEYRKKENPALTPRARSTSRTRSRSVSLTRAEAQTQRALNLLKQREEVDYDKEDSEREPDRPTGMGRPGSRLDSSGMRGSVIPVALTMEQAVAQRDATQGREKTLREKAEEERALLARTQAALAIPKLATMSEAGESAKKGPPPAMKTMMDMPAMASSSSSSSSASSFTPATTSTTTVPKTATVTTPPITTAVATAMTAATMMMSDKPNTMMKSMGMQLEEVESSVGGSLLPERVLSLGEQRMQSRAQNSLMQRAAGYDKLETIGIRANNTNENGIGGSTKGSLLRKVGGNNNSSGGTPMSLRNVREEIEESSEGDEEEEQEQEREDEALVEKSLLKLQDAFKQKQLATPPSSSTSSASLPTNTLPSKPTPSTTTTVTLPSKPAATTVSNAALPTNTVTNGTPAANTPANTSMSAPPSATTKPMMSSPSPETSAEMASKTAELKQLQEQRERLLQETATLETQRKQLQAQSAQEQASLDAKKAEVRKLQEERDCLSKENTELELKQQQLVTQSTQEQATKETNKAELTKLQENKVKLTQETLALEAQKQLLTSQTTQEESLISARKAEVKQLEQQKSVLTQENQTLENKKKQVQKETEQLQTASAGIKQATTTEEADLELLLSQSFNVVVGGKELSTSLRVLQSYPNTFFENVKSALKKGSRVPVSLDRYGEMFIQLLDYFRNNKLSELTFNSVLVHPASFRALPSSLEAMEQPSTRVARPQITERSEMPMRAPPSDNLEGAIMAIGEIIAEKVIKDRAAAKKATNTATTASDKAVTTTTERYANNPTEKLQPPERAAIGRSVTEESTVELTSFGRVEGGRRTTELELSERLAEEKLASENLNKRLELERNAEILAKKERLATEKMATEKVQSERVAAEKEIEKARAERLQAEREAEQAASARVTAEREAELAAVERATAQKQAENAAAQRAAERAQADRLAIQRAEERQAQERAAANEMMKRAALEKAENERIIAERQAKELQQEKMMKLEAERIAAETRLAAELAAIAKMSDLEAWFALRVKFPNELGPSLSLEEYKTLKPDELEDFLREAVPNKAMKLLFKKLHSV